MFREVDIMGMVRLQNQVQSIILQFLFLKKRNIFIFVIWFNVKPFHLWSLYQSSSISVKLMITNFVNLC